MVVPCIDLNLSAQLIIWLGVATGHGTTPALQSRSLPQVDSSCNSWGGYLPTMWEQDKVHLAFCNTLSQAGWLIKSHQCLTHSSAGYEYKTRPWQLRSLLRAFLASGMAASSCLQRAMRRSNITSYFYFLLYLSLYCSCKDTNVSHEDSILMISPTLKYLQKTQYLWS